MVTLRVIVAVALAVPCQVSGSRISACVIGYTGVQAQGQPRGGVMVDIHSPLPLPIKSCPPALTLYPSHFQPLLFTLHIFQYPEHLPFAIASTCYHSLKSLPLPYPSPSL